MRLHTEVQKMGFLVRPFGRGGEKSHAAMAMVPEGEALSFLYRSLISLRVQRNIARIARLALSERVVRDIMFKGIKFGCLTVAVAVVVVGSVVRFVPQDS
jgi:hypothetical protein